ncbi:cation:proton antiporter domain-containing protein [Pararhodospirillum oryzae]|uniref:cation:proton antiporter domain-containing protein n=1 Tax=Pararhodospirillum oryzae TaxID=478448 RepID=UPI0011BDCB46
MHDTPLLSTFAMSLVFAAPLGWLASRLHLSPLVGYLLAGIAVGPFTPGFVANGPLAQELAEVGVILLMFGVGLHFSVRDLWAVRHIAIPGALGQIAVATLIGGGLALWWDWGWGAGLVFGLALSVASTVVLLRALEDRNQIDTERGRIAVGWLVVEDLAMVIALVLLPALAGSQGEGTDGAVSEASLALTLGLTVAKVGLFIVLVLVAGGRIVPRILEVVARQNSRELFTLTVLALAMGLAYLSSTLFGVSFALGAFFAGLVMSESKLSHQAAADSLPLKDAFAVLFFVSVGMLFDPELLWADPLAVLAVVLVIVVGKSLAAFAIVRMFGYGRGTALTVSASLAQIGEFSFILAGLGVSLGLLPQAGLSYILAGALLSIALNPLLFHALGPLERWLGGDSDDAPPPPAASPTASLPTSPPTSPPTSKDTSSS